MRQKGEYGIFRKGLMEVKNHAGSGALYGTGVIGALFYFLGNANTFAEVVVGFIKSLFWLGVLVYEALRILGL